MKAPRLDALTRIEKDELAASIRDVIDDAHVRVSVSYVGASAVSVNIETGVVTRTESTDAVNAVRGQISQAEIDRSGGKLMQGDRRYLIDQADLTAAPTQIDRITDGQTYEVIGWDEDPLGVYYVFTARRV